MRRLSVILFPLAIASAAFADPAHLGQTARIASHFRDSSEDEFQASIEAGWGSRYLAEGREVWADNGIFSGLLVLGFNDFAIELWQGFSDGTAEREFHGSVQYTVFRAPVSMTLGLTHVDDLSGGDNDNDASVSLIGPLPFGAEWDLNYYYGFERDGGFLEAGFSRTWEMDWVDVSLGAHLGSNLGYVVDGHKGPDHLVLSAELFREIMENLTVRAGYSYHFRIDRDPTSHIQDLELYGGPSLGIAAEYSF